MYRQHLEELAREHNVVLRLKPYTCYTGVVGQAFFASPNIVEVFDWDGSQRGYVAGLHEFGHVAHGHLEDYTRLYATRILEAECEAWQWALDNLREPLKPETVKRYFKDPDTGLRSYIRDYGTHPKAEQLIAAVTSGAVASDKLIVAGDVVHDPGPVFSDQLV
jgi:hypothetical protein